jgi:hypothetical protein
MPILRSKERLVQARFLMDLVRLIVPPRGLREPHFEQTVILAAVALGELEGRPFQTSKLAEFLGVPRPTLVRRLRGMAEEGLIERRAGHYFANPGTINSPEMNALTDRLTEMILSTARELQAVREK